MIFIQLQQNRIWSSTIPDRFTVMTATGLEPPALNLKYLTPCLSIPCLIYDGIKGVHFLEDLREMLIQIMMLFLHKSLIIHMQGYSVKVVLCHTCVCTRDVCYHSEHCLDFKYTMIMYHTCLKIL
jgi:hypothetical protein